jgi:conjugative transfer signal peptidase TraF
MKRALLAAALGAFSLFAAGAAGVRVNVSSSIPLGVYRTVDAASIERDDYVLVCPPQTALFDEARARGYFDPGFCPGNYGYLMKRVAGRPGDRVSIQPEGVWVNGQRIPYSAQRNADGLGRSLPRFFAHEHVLDTTQFLLMSNSNPKSFDARYFGPVTRSQIVSVLLPVVTRGKS